MTKTNPIPFFFHHLGSNFFCQDAKDALFGTIKIRMIRKKKKTKKGKSGLNISNVFFLPGNFFLFLVNFISMSSKNKINTPL